MAISPEHQARLEHFRAYTVAHPYLSEVDEIITQYIYEPGGFAHVLVYGPTGVGKTTLAQRLAERFQAETATGFGHRRPHPVIRIETPAPFTLTEWYINVLVALDERIIEERYYRDVQATTPGGVDDDVYFAEGGFKRSRLIINHQVGSQRADIVQIGVGCGADDVSALPARQLYRVTSHAPCRAVDQDALPRLQIGQVEEGHPGGASADGNGCRLIKAESARREDECIGSRKRILGVGAFPLSTPDVEWLIVVLGA